MRPASAIATVLSATLAAQAGPGVGAPQSPHWSFVAPQRPALPAVANAEWPRNAIDWFVLARMEQHGLSPNDAADRATLLRRLSLDLTGLPPTLDELDAYLADAGGDAYERAAERLLGSPRAAEHQARYWLDAARYGDTHGMEADYERTLWPWRDWVLAAFAQNMPFDTFTIEQLAGDLLPGATDAQRIATGFHRNGMSTAEGGLIADELLVRYASERAEVTATVWLGLTLGCARCHDHKYDPITQRDYYALADFFHSIDEAGSNENAAAPPPNLPVPTAAQLGELAALERELAAQQQRRGEIAPELAAAADEWIAAEHARLGARWRPLQVNTARARSGAVLEVGADATVLVRGAVGAQDEFELDAAMPAGAAGLFGALRVEALRTDDGRGPGCANNGNFVLSDLAVTAAAAGGSARPIRLHDAVADFAQRGFAAAAAIDGDPKSGWAVLGGDGDHALVCAADAALPQSDGPPVLHVTLRFDSPHAQHVLRRFRIAVAADAAPPQVTSSPWQRSGPLPQLGTEVLVAAAEPALPADAAFAAADLADGEVHALPAVTGTTLLERTLRADRDCTAVFAFGSDDGLGVWLDGSPVFARDVRRAAAPDQEFVALPLHAGDNRLRIAIVNTGGPAGVFCRHVGTAPDGEPPSFVALLAEPPAQRTAAATQRLREHWRRRHDPAFAATSAAIADLERRIATLQQRAPRSMVMRERSEPRPSFVLQRGRYDLPQERVAADTPAFLPPLPAGVPHDRLALARWLVAGDNPLTARVVVNRLWQQVFGRGLVDTPHDLGSKGSAPSHPELLDWLAREFVDSGWDQRHMLRLFVTSATYRQSAAATTAQRERDPDNRWLARAPRHRLDAEVLRDQALLLAGLLQEQRGGPSARIYQPPGVWEAVAYPGSNTEHYEQDHGDALWRRSVYTFWKRTAPPPLLALLDAPSRETCAVFRERTDTPLQALALLNDTGFAEAARAFAQRCMREPGSADARLARAFRACTTHTPQPRELALLRALLQQARERFAAEPDAAARYLRVGESPAAADLDAGELAAFAVVAATLLNLDATLSRS